MKTRNSTTSIFDLCQLMLDALPLDFDDEEAEMSSDISASSPIRESDVFEDEEVGLEHATQLMVSEWPSSEADVDYQDPEGQRIEEGGDGEVPLQKEGCIKCRARAGSHFITSVTFV